MDVMLYFWDDRDGPDFCGWWFGPKVRGSLLLLPWLRYIFLRDEQILCPSLGTSLMVLGDD